MMMFRPSPIATTETDGRPSGSRSKIKPLRRNQPIRSSPGGVPRRAYALEILEGFIEQDHIRVFCVHLI